MFDPASFLVLVAVSSTTMYEITISIELVKQPVINFAKDKHERVEL